MGAGVQVVICSVKRIANLDSGTQIGEGKVPDGFAIARVHVGTMVIILANGVAVCSAAQVGDGERDTVRQFPDDRVITVVTAVAGALLGVVQVLIDPHITLNLDHGVEQRDRDRIRLLNQRVTGIVDVEVVGGVLEGDAGIHGAVGIGSAVELHVVGIILDVGVVGDDSGMSGCDLHGAVKDDHKGCDVFFVRRDCCRPVLRRRRPGPCRPHCGLRLGYRSFDAAGVVVDRVMLGSDVYTVHGDGLELIKDHVPLGITVRVIVHLGDHVADRDILCSFCLTVVDQQTPLDPACEVRSAAFAVRSGCNAQAGIMETAVLVALNRLGEVQRVSDYHGDLVLSRDPAIIIYIGITFPVKSSFHTGEVNRTCTGCAITIRRVFKRLTEVVSIPALAHREGVAIGVGSRVIGVYRGRQIYIVPNPHHSRRLVIGCCAGVDHCIEINRYTGARLEVAVELEGNAALGIGKGLSVHFSSTLHTFHRGNAGKGHGFALRSVADHGLVAAFVVVLQTSGQNVHKERILKVNL